MLRFSYSASRRTHGKSGTRRQLLRGERLEASAGSAAGRGRRGEERKGRWGAAEAAGTRTTPRQPLIGIRGVVQVCVDEAAILQVADATRIEAAGVASPLLLERGVQCALHPAARGALNRTLGRLLRLAARRVRSEE